MNTEQSQFIPFTQRLAQEGIITTTVNEVSTFNEGCASPDFFIAVCQAGSVDGSYDANSVTFRQADVAVIYPHHVLEFFKASSDLQIALIAVSQHVFSSISSNIVLSNRFNDEQLPLFNLDPEQYAELMKLVEAMHSVGRLDSPMRLEMQVAMLEIIVEFVNVFRSNNTTSTVRNDRSRLSKRFYEAIIEHCPKQRNVVFYADLFCLSSKHFSEVIRNETGHSASHWIHNYVITEAKMMLRNHSDTSLQQISEQLYFPDQASFSRYFKREVGVSPAEWRHKLTRKAQ